MKKSDNIEITIRDDADEDKKKISDTLKNRYRNNLQSMKGSAFVFDYGQLLHCNCHKLNLNRGGSFTDSPEWIKK